MTEFSVRYTCSLQQSPDKTYSVDVPWEETTEIPLTADAVWNFIRADKSLLEELFAADFASYEDRSRFPAHYGTYLQRVNETVYVKIDAPEETVEEEEAAASVGIRKSLKKSIKNLLSKNLFARGTDNDEDASSTTIVRAYVKD